jgi:C4-type Zn-finger protein
VSGTSDIVAMRMTRRGDESDVYRMKCCGTDMVRETEQRTGTPYGHPVVIWTARCSVCGLRAEGVTLISQDKEGRV